ncbi:TrbG/VirB9 family P-type conjugative transfer protein [Sulfurimonas sp.]|uniref:TrbG/VirB9 family P-type conjugative transfer protein n=1 Tax=Sulfurimonas sp. TaxID=2022749 RepID=UPI002B464AA5|nr:TrbG/VirB9 family P-type conjugative transfer protein [Sulfurimonas sp.]
MKKIFLIIVISINIFAFEDFISEKTTKVEDISSEIMQSSIGNIIDLDSLQKVYLTKPTNDAIISYKYSPKNLMKIRTRILGQTTVILPKGEIPVSKKNGNPAAFKIEFSKGIDFKYNINNTFTITAGYIGTDTTLTIFGQSGRVYNFYLYSIGTDSAKIPNSTVYITKNGKIPTANYLDDFDVKDQKISKLRKEIKKYKQKLNLIKEKKTKNLKNFNITKIQFDYKFKKDFQLQSIFNDKEYTYFKFDKEFNIPKFFTVDTLHDKVNMNFTMFENIIKIHKLSKKWQLELDGSYITIEKTGEFKANFSLKKIYVDMTETEFDLKSISGAKELKPETIFRDKEFTYFKFDISDGFKKFPAIYKVIDGYDNPAIFEIIDDFIVVKSLNKKFTLRLGEKHNCIRLEDD